MAEPRRPRRHRVSTHKYVEAPTQTDNGRAEHRDRVSQIHEARVLPNAGFAARALRALIAGYGLRRRYGFRSPTADRTGYLIPPPATTAAKSSNPPATTMTGRVHRGRRHPSVC